jgi:hypothetical protein
MSWLFLKILIKKTLSLSFFFENMTTLYDLNLIQSPWPKDMKLAENNQVPYYDKNLAPFAQNVANCFGPRDKALYVNQVYVPNPAWVWGSFKAEDCGLHPPSINSYEATQDIVGIKVKVQQPPGLIIRQQGEKQPEEKSKLERKMYDRELGTFQPYLKLDPPHRDPTPFGFLRGNDLMNIQ